MKQAFASLKRMFFLKLTVGLFYVLAAALFVAPVYFLSKAADDSYRSSYGVIIALLFALFILAAAAAIAAQTLTCAADAVCVYEKQGALSALKNAYALCRGSFSNIAAVLSMWYFTRLAVYLAVSSLCALPALTAQFLGGSFSAYFAAALSLVFQYITFIVTSALTAPMGDIIYALIYFNQKMKNFGLDIVIKAGL